MFEKGYQDLVSLEELCEMLSIGKNTAYRILNTGQLNAFKMGRIWKIPRQAVSEYVLKNSGLSDSFHSRCR